MSDSPDNISSDDLSVCHDFRIVRPQHLNQYGALFGGFLLQMIDEQAFIVCHRRYPGRNFVTRAMANVEFHASATLGDLLETIARIERVGRTSVSVRVQVFICDPENRSRRLSFDGVVTMVSIDQSGVPRPVADEPAGPR